MSKSMPGAAVSDNLNNSELTRFAGGFMLVASVSVSMVVMFAVPISCTVVSGIGLSLAALVFVAGLVTFLIGQIRLWRPKKPK